MGNWIWTPVALVAVVGGAMGAVAYAENAKRAWRSRRAVR